MNVADLKLPEIVQKENPVDFHPANIESNFQRNKH
jgi:hypothetical protein